MKKRKGFTLIELVIVIVIIGIISLIVVLNIRDITRDSKISTFNANYMAVKDAYGMYMADNNGDTPTQDSDLDKFFSEGFASLQDKPPGSTYTIKDGKIIATYIDDKLDINIQRTYPR